MVIARRKGVQVVETVYGEGILWGIVTKSSGVAGNLALGDVVSSLGTEKQAIATKDSICGESGALNRR